jgi:hypothetical protein
VRDGLMRRTEWAVLRGKGSADLWRLRHDHPSFPSRPALVRAAADLRVAYREYVRDVSTPGMAASLETSAVLLALCRTERVSSAIDLGSGFSSYVLRRWAVESDCVVLSVDDDPSWLEATEAFLAAHSVSCAGLCRWPSIPESSRSFDLVFHDFAQGAKREETIPMAMQLASRFVVFDDAQDRGHRAAMAAACARNLARLYSLRSITLDGMRRYAMMAITS